MKTFKKTSSALLRLTIGLAIIAYLFHKIDMASVGAVSGESLNQWPWLLAAILLLFLCLCIGAVRWGIILDAQDLRMSWVRTSAVYFIGHFFNSFMFGATGGDVVRAYYATKETHHKKTEAVATVIIDRVIGMIVLFLIAGVMLIVKARFYLDHPKTHIPVLVMLIMIAAGTAGVVFIFNFNRFKDWLIFRWITNSPKMGPTVRRLAMAFDLYRRRTSVLIATALLSAGNHTFIVLICYCLGRSLQIHLQIIDYLAVIPMVMCVAAVPITPGGLGLREGLSVALLGAMGVGSAQALALALMLYAIMLGWSLVGGIIFLGYSASSGHTIHEEMLELRHEAAGDNG
ncbi:lysylphosphatidylglycerol synthase transmembrane domain-containing protein [Verrucomicrobiota bacterium]